METSNRGLHDHCDGIALINTEGNYIVKRVTDMGKCCRLLVDAAVTVRIQQDPF